MVNNRQKIYDHVHHIKQVMIGMFTRSTIFNKMDLTWCLFSRIHYLKNTMGLHLYFCKIANRRSCKLSSMERIKFNVNTTKTNVINCKFSICFSYGKVSFLITFIYSFLSTEFIWIVRDDFIVYKNWSSPCWGEVLNLQFSLWNFA